MIRHLGILVLSLGTVAVAATAYADGPSFGDFDLHHQHDKKCYVHCVTSAPEIDPASALSALTLLGGGLLVLRSRNKKK